MKPPADHRCSFPLYQIGVLGYKFLAIATLAMGRNLYKVALLGWLPNVTQLPSYGSLFKGIFGVTRVYTGILTQTLVVPQENPSSLG